MHCTYLQLTLIDWSPLQSSVLLVQVFQTRYIYAYFVDGVHILWLGRQFLVSLTWTLFFLPRSTFSWTSYFFLWSAFFFQKSSLPGLWDTQWWRLIIASHPAVANKRPVISFSPPFSLSSFSFSVPGLEAKHRSHRSTKSGSSRDN